MSQTDLGPNSTVRWEILKGLPGEGPLPKYFHLGHPTPWSEGLAVRFWNADGTQWVGNFQGLQDWSAKILVWPEAGSIAVLAMDGFYLVDARNPDSYVTLGSQCLVDDVMLDEERNLLFVAEATRIHAYGRNRRLLWTRSGLGGYDAQLKNCVGGVLTVEIEEETGEPRKMVRLSANDGSNV
jgi:hypothetical protein